MKFFALLFLACTAQALSGLDQDLPNGGQLFAILVAGSNGYFNYRHQADVCHAYQILHSHGVPDSNIITFMYDDIAHNEANPTPGVILNAPNGTNVYKDIVKDYTGKDVTPANFLSVLQGKPMTGIGSGKTLKSGPHDHVFVFFADHGAPGLIAFPAQFLKATELNKALKAAHKSNLFSKLVFYLEACESGSMFKGLLPKDIDVFATTAANSTTSSYACYYDPVYKTFLGDVYSVKWMEDSDANNIEKETLHQQFKHVARETNTSQVREFGDLDIARLPVGQFQGLKADDADDDAAPPPPFPDTCGRDARPGPDVAQAVLERLAVDETLTQEQRDEAAKKLEDLLQEHKEMDQLIERIVGQVAAAAHVDQILAVTPEITQHSCYYECVQAFHDKCYNLGQHEYALRKLQSFANLCELGYDSAPVVKLIEQECAAST